MATAILDPRDVQAAIDALGAADVLATTTGVRDSDGELHQQVRLQPTENLIAAALRCAAVGMRLYYDGQDVFVIQAKGGLPDQSADDQGSSPDEVVITPAALEVARAAGISVEEIEGTGVNGRITKQDVINLMDMMAKESQ